MLRLSLIPEMTKTEKIKQFDPNGIGQLNEGMFGLPFTLEECETVLVPVPWEVTVSYGGGTAEGPEAILNASYQVDLYDPFIKDAWKNGIALAEIDEEIKNKSETLRTAAEHYIYELANGEDADNDNLKQIAVSVKEGCLWMNDQVKKKVQHYMKQGKYVGLI